MNHPIPLDPQTNKHKHIVNDSTKGSFGSYCNLNRHNVLDEINLVGSISCNADSGPQQWAGLLTAQIPKTIPTFFFPISALWAHYVPVNGPVDVVRYNYCHYLPSTLA